MSNIAPPRVVIAARPPPQRGSAPPRAVIAARPPPQRVSVPPRAVIAAVAGLNNPHNFDDMRYNNFVYFILNIINYYY